MAITAITIPLRPETDQDKPSFTMVRSAAPFAPNNTRTCLFVRAKQSDDTAGVDVWDVTDPPIVVADLKATLNKVPFQDELYLYPLGAMDTGPYIDLPVVMMGWPSQKGIGAILRSFDTPTIVRLDPLGEAPLYPGIGIYARPEISTLPSLAFYVSDSKNVYLVRTGFGQLQLSAQLIPPQPGRILTRPHGQSKPLRPQSWNVQNRRVLRANGRAWFELCFGL
jgi:hypothetical protein